LDAVVYFVKHAGHGNKERRSNNLEVFTKSFYRLNESYRSSELEEVMKFSGDPVAMRPGKNCER
jgi:hypothetical protein